jgi:hypothetical protein
MDEHRIVVVNGVKHVVDRLFFPLYYSCHLAYALHFLFMRISHLAIWYINLQLFYEAGFLYSYIPPTTILDNLKTK